MDITWYGQSCFLVKGKDATVAVDPFADIGLKEPKLEADVLLVSHDHFDHANVAAVSGREGGDPYVVDTPGEYESKGVMIEGIPTYHDDKQGADRGRNTVYSFHVDDMHLVHLGDLGHVLDEDTVERLGDVDVLFVPVGGHFTIDAKAAADVVKLLQPRITVPMHYQVPKLKVKELAAVDKFLGQVGGKVRKLEKKTFKLKHSDLPENESQVVVFPSP
ncbi:MAG TPA: MBL fold metallo-hydrolase [Patescibacteria group bacterium]